MYNGDQKLVKIFENQSFLSVLMKTYILTMSMVTQSRVQHSTQSFLITYISEFSYLGKVIACTKDTTLSQMGFYNWASSGHLGFKLKIRFKNVFHRLKYKMNTDSIKTFTQTVQWVMNFFQGWERGSPLQGRKLGNPNYMQFYTHFVSIFLRMSKRALEKDFSVRYLEQ